MRDPKRAAGKPRKFGFTAALLGFGFILLKD